MACIENCVLEFHTDDVPGDVSDTLQFNGKNFGVLRLKMPKVNITTKPTMILFTIDATGSMNERIDNGNTKMDIVKQSFRSIVNYLSKQNAPIFIAVHAFNDKINIVLDTIQIDETNAKNAIEKINNIHAEGGTNIELALRNAKNTLNDYLEKHHDHQIAHVFMTDGNSTIGSGNIEELNLLVVENKSGNVFIGFGNDHNLPLLKRLSENKRSYYQFINNFENTACIYGEIMYPYLYPCIENATLLVENGEIYNWKTNTWTNRIDEDVLVSESEKIYHVRKLGETDVTIDVYGIDVVGQEKEDKLLEKVYELPHLIAMETNDIIKTDLTPYMFRQKTQELLFACIQKNDQISDKEWKRERRDEIKALFDKIRCYMRESNKLEDSFMKQLCDDLYVSYSTMYSYENAMATLSRLTTQGRQQTNVYTPRTGGVTPKPVFDLGAPRRPKMSRQNTAVINPFDLSFSVFDSQIDVLESNIILPPSPIESPVESMSEIDTYQIAQIQTSCYATPTVLDTMTQIQTDFH
jgi:hypothetical protein